MMVKGSEVLQILCKLPQNPTEACCSHAHVLALLTAIRPRLVNRAQFPCVLAFVALWRFCKQHNSSRCGQNNCVSVSDTPLIRQKPYQSPRKLQKSSTTRSPETRNSGGCRVLIFHPCTRPVQVFFLSGFQASSPHGKAPHDVRDAAYLPNVSLKLCRNAAATLYVAAFVQDRTCIHTPSYTHKWRCCVYPCPAAGDSITGGLPCCLLHPGMAGERADVKL